MLETMIAIMMIKANMTQFATTTRGEFYEVTIADYDKGSNTTYAIFSRYWATEGGNVTGRHFQLRPYAGKFTNAQLLQDARDRSDKYVTVISALK